VGKLQSTARISVYWRAPATNWGCSGDDWVRDLVEEKQGREEKLMV
jgi:hypothetical protein